MKRPDIAALVLAGVFGLAIAVLAGMHVQSPDVLTFLAIGALSAGAGVAIPTPLAGSSTKQARADAPDPSPAPVPAPAAAPALETVTATPVATHAP